MHRKIVSVICFTFIIVLVAASTLFANNSRSGSDIDRSHGEEEKWRIGYVEGEPFVNFSGTLHGLLEGFQAHGWVDGIDEMPFVTGQEDSRSMWEWLAAHDTGPYLEFVEDAHYSFELEPGTEEDILTRLEEKNDLDMVIAMGTYAGQILATDTHDVPVMNFSTSNAVDSGIIESEEDSGKEHIWAHVDPGRDRRLVEVFCDLFEFQTMGLAYEDSELGRIYSAIDEVEAVAAERGFEVVRRHVDEPADSDDRERYYREVLAAHTELAKEVDAFYLSIAAIEASRLEELLVPFYKNNVPVFSQLGGEEVASGAVASVNRADFSEIGLFGSDAIIRVLEGESPRDQLQTFTLNPLIAVNLEAATRVGYKVPFEILLVADRVYRTIN